MLEVLAFVKKHLLLMGVFGFVILSFALTQPVSAQSAPTLTMQEGNRQVVATGGWVAEILDGRSRFDFETTYYNSSGSTKEILFKRVGTTNIYVTHVFDFFNKQADTRCWPALDIRFLENSAALVTGVSSGPDRVPPGQVLLSDSECSDEIKAQNEWNSSLAIKYSGDNSTGELVGDSQGGYVGIEIPVCRAGDAACATKRSAAIDQANNAKACSTGSVQAIQDCNDHKAIIACLRSDVTKTVSSCKDVFDANNIVKGDTSSINAGTTDPRIAAICGTLSSERDKVICIANANKARFAAICFKEPTTDGCPSEADSSSCVIEGVGWMVCPLFNFLGGIADASFTIIEGFLKTDIGIFAPDSGTARAWGIMRNFANVGFVIVFLIIIFSQLSSVGITNYGVKKMLPRLIIAAILVNLSYFISQIAVDLSNVLGGSLKALLDNLPIFPADTGDPFVNENFFTDLVSSVLAPQLAGGAIAGVVGAAYIGGPALLIPIVLAAVLALLVIILILIARQALIVLLVVVSPLAFLAMLLPNTENLFKQWRKIFVALLILYPAIALLFGGSKLAAGILIQSNGAGLLGQLMAAAVMVLPLLAVPALLKGSLNAIPGIGQFATSLQNRANGNLTKKSKENYAMSTFGRGQAIRKQARANFRDKRFSEMLSAGNGPKGTLARVAAGGLASLGWTKGQRAQKEALVRAAKGTAATAQSEAVKQQMAVYQEKFKNDSGAMRTHIVANHGNMNDVEMEAASDLMLGAGGVSDYRAVIGNSDIMSTHARSLGESGRRNETEVRKKAADIANWNNTAGATEGVAYSATTTMTPSDPDTGISKSYIEDAYGNAEAAKLITMDPVTAGLAAQHIDKEQAKLAVIDQNFSSAKKDTQDILTRVAGP